MQLPVTLIPRSSPTLGGALVLAHALAGMGLAPTNLPPALKVALALVLALSLVFSLRRHVFRPPLVALTLKADGRLEVDRLDGARAEATVHPQTTVFPWLVVLLLRMETETLALTLPPDAFEPEQYRRLRLWLRWKAAVE